jgi:hypothetical protein
MADAVRAQGVHREATVLEPSVLVVRQDELRGSYRIDDRDDKRIAVAVPVGESPLKWILRSFGFGELVSRSLEVRDPDGRPWLELVRPRTAWSSNFVVSRPDGAELARMEHRSAFGKKVLGLVAGGKPVGELQGDWSASTFTVVDASGRVVASATKGLGSSLGFLPDSYAVEVTERIDDPLASLVLVAAMCFDLAFNDE